MNVIDRFTRGRQALTVWVVLTVVFFGAFAFVRVGASRGVTDQIDEAESRR